MEDLSYAEQQEAIAEAIERFPDEFGLRNFPGRKFRISPAASYFSTSEGLLLYTSVWNKESDRWLDFAKGTEQELRREVVAL